MKRIRSLDGARAIAIIMVLFAHVALSINPALVENKLYFLLGNGKLGVNIFFVISGYLITKLLVFEREKTGSISLKNFYLRRIFRIFPVFYMYIIVVILLKCLFIPTLFQNYTMIGFAACFLWNYANLFHIHVPASDNSFFLFAHFWSLSMEEQFYLIWPIMLIKLNADTLKKTVIVIILIIPLIRIATYFFMPGSRGQIDMMIQTGGNTIFMGCLGALIENTKFFKEKILRIIYNKVLISLIAIFLFIISPLLSIYFKGIYRLPIGNSLDILCIMMLLFWCIYVPSKVSDFLNSKVLVQIGILSYSIYIWQQLFLVGNVQFWFNQFPQNIFLVFVVSFISYYAVEKPILKLKKRFARV